ncbi:hypothetical protein NPIL_663791 [Nephila pilipes]|uniref:Uncharacterized protein n=1 Tax=Nephila pilipes TaxID=299642 RepID=A0A8X6QPL3_NEPPI|nr:hypothetical protein NPIL_663791 [Nephila pilipes]
MMREWKQRKPAFPGSVIAPRGKNARWEMEKNDYDGPNASSGGGRSPKEELPLDPPRKALKRFFPRAPPQIAFHDRSSRDLGFPYYRSDFYV